MLILTRRLGESVVVGHDIVIRVLQIKGSQVRLGVTAPPTTPVDREEIYIRKELERKAAR